jgi:hypothetical protein
MVFLNQMMELIKVVARGKGSPPPSVALVEKKKVLFFG